MRGRRSYNRRISLGIYDLSQPFTVRLDHGGLPRGYQRVNAYIP